MYCFFVDFKKAFDAVPRHLLSKVLKEMGIHKCILDIVKFMNAHDSATVSSSEGISAVFRCLLGVKQGCPLSPTLFGLYVSALERHLLDTAGIDAPTFRGTLVLESPIVVCRQSHFDVNLPAACCSWSASLTADSLRS